MASSGSGGQHLKSGLPASTARPNSAKKNVSKPAVRLVQPSAGQSSHRSGSRAMASRLKAYAEGMAEGVFPRVRVMPGMEAQRTSPVVVQRRFSSIDGLPLRPAQGFTRSSSCMHQSRSRSPNRRRRKAISQALYFVTILKHRTLACCEACGQKLSGPETDLELSGACESSVVGFRLEQVRRGEAPVRWSHASPTCLGQLCLPRVAPSEVESEIVFSSEVGEAVREAVLLVLARADDHGCSLPARPVKDLQLQRWSYAPACRRQVSTADVGRGDGDSAGQAPGSISSKRLSTETLSREDLAQISKEGEAVPFCVICLQEFEEADKVVRLPCTHLYHSKCAAEWLSRRPVCPLDLAPVEATLSTL